MLVMEEYTFTFIVVNKMKNSGSERVVGLTPPLTQQNKVLYHCLAIKILNIEKKKMYRKHLYMQLYHCWGYGFF